MHNWTTKKSNNLNVLRAVAVLCVFFGHGIQFSSSLLEPTGRAMAHFGVMFFFVHTSLVLMQSLERQEAQDGRSRLWLKFMVRRIFRIYPLSIITVLLSAAFAVPCITGCQLVRFDAITPASLFANIALIQEFVGLPSIPCVLWSLPYEMLMYCFLPALYLLARKKDPTLMIALWFISAIALSLLGSTHFFKYMRFTPCFLAGAIAYSIGYRPKLRSPLWLPSVITCVAFVALLRPKVLFTDWALCLMVGLAIPNFHDMGGDFGSRAAEKIAKYSFGIYLAHLGAYRLAFGV